MMEYLKMIGSFFVVNVGSWMIALDWAAYAQVVPTDPLSGNSGWVGTGLLGAVLSWLLFVHLPNKDKQIKDLTECHAKIEVEQRATHAAVELTQREAHLKVESLQRGTFEVTMKTMTDHCRDEFDRILNHYTRVINLRQDGESIHKVSEPMETRIIVDEVKSKTQRDNRKTQIS